MRTLEESRELQEHLTGMSLREIGERLGMSHEAARRIVRCQAREHITDLAGRLLVNRRTGELEVFVIPDHSGPAFDLAVSYFTWAIRELGELGLRVRIHYRPVENGVALGVEESRSEGGDD